MCIRDSVVVVIVVAAVILLVIVDPVVVINVRIVIVVIVAIVVDAGVTVGRKRIGRGSCTSHIQQVLNTLPLRDAQFSVVVVTVLVVIVSTVTVACVIVGVFLLGRGERIGLESFESGSGLLFCSGLVRIGNWYDLFLEV